MNNWSLKFKVFGVLVILTSSMLLAYGWLASSDFESDKLAYVLDTTMASSRSAAIQIRTELLSLSDRISLFLAGYENGKFHTAAEDIFQNDKVFESCSALEYDLTNKNFSPAGKLVKASLANEDLEEGILWAQRMSDRILKEKIMVTINPKNSKWFLGVAVQTQNKQLILVSTIHNIQFQNLFETPQMHDLYLVSNQAETIQSPTVKSYDLENASLLKIFNQILKNAVSAEGTQQITLKKEIWYSAKANIEVGNMSVISLIPREAALRGVKLFLIKSFLFFGLLLFFTIFLSVISSTTLTHPLKALLFATQEISKGNFSAQIKIQSHDEMGKLGEGFNKMTGEIQRLLKETVEKSRMENELRTAQLVQSTLFPKEELKLDDIEVHGFYEPASECSGDWWFYKRLGHRTIFCIGDATGHGVPAALLTAAARSVASTLEAIPDLSLIEMMKLFNRSIYNTASGEVLMTFFLAAYDHQTEHLAYVNASHEPPILLPSKPELNRNDLIFLHESVGVHLGRDEHSEFEVVEIKINPGDQIFFYTDGVTELVNKAEKYWGLRSLVKCLVQSTNDNLGPSETMKKIASEIQKHRGHQPLKDDVTYFMVSRSKSA